MSRHGWIGVDLDGTLAEYHGWGDGSIGKPIPLMLARVKQWLAEGKDVRIFTARVSTAGRSEDEIGGEIALQLNGVRNWSKEHIGVVLPVTWQKDFAMIELWDDRAVQVIPNTGLRADGLE